MVLGGLREYTAYPWIVRVAALVGTGWVTYSLARNTVRLWRAPAMEADAGTVVRLAAVGAWFLLVSSGPLLEGGASVKPPGVVAAFLAGNLWALAARDVTRIGRNRHEHISLGSH